MIKKKERQLISIVCEIENYGRLDIGVSNSNPFAFKIGRKSSLFQR